MSESNPSLDPMPSPSQKRHWRLIGVTTCLLLTVSVVLVFFLFRSGIHVTVQNSGSQPLRSVALYVTGASYNLGDIAPGETATARIKPTGESHLEIEFIDADGQTQRLDAGGYFESGYRGTIRVEMKDGQIDKFEEDIKVW